MRFLIIVPTLNSYRLLPKLIDSIRKQIFKEWRVIFVDGDSEIEHKNYLRKICDKDPRFKYISQKKERKGIYGAMNQGFSYVLPNEWALFLGSDDWLAFDDVLLKINNMNKKPNFYHLLIGNAVYVENDDVLLRNSFFDFFRTFKLSFLLGSSPAHQGTLYSYLLNEKKYDENYKLAGDLEHFLSISKFKGLNLFITKQIITHMSNGGVSQKYNLLRTKEVMKAYIKHFGIIFFVPLFFRYLKRLISLIK
tara:strand:+ start:456 stop:1205 length:750 start_codon:yes stop_codon:yes gene_type:complete